MTVVFTVLFEPLDVLVFKDHRPFDAGEHSAAGSRWPLPGAFFGALRTALMLDQHADFSRKPGFGLSESVREWLGDQESPGKLRLRGPLLVQTRRRTSAELDVFFPAPLYCEAPLDVPSALRFPGAETLPALPWPRDPARKAKESGSAEVILTANGLEQWQSGGEARRELRDAIAKPAHSDSNGQLLWRRREDLVRMEARTGLARSESRTATEGMLYTLHAWRFKDGVALGVELEAAEEAVSSIELLDGRVVPLGGKAHRARLRVSRHRLLPEAPKISGDLCVAFLSPVILSQSERQRGDVDAAPALANVKPVSLSAVLLPPEGAELACLYTTRNGLPHGGWDFANRRPRPLTPMLPAGTVAYLLGADPSKLHEATWGQSEALHRAGFGTFIYGTW